MIAVAWLAMCLWHRLKTSTRGRVNPSLGTYARVWMWVTHGWAFTTDGRHMVCRGGRVRELGARTCRKRSNFLIFWEMGAAATRTK